MNNLTLLPLKVKIRKCPSYFSGFFITLEWHLCAILPSCHNMKIIALQLHNMNIVG